MIRRLYVTYLHCWCI